jgi:cation diffusion facilitator CzcD-associated flavoprotein CzcO
MAGTDFDVLIVGAGLSGIGAAYHLKTKLPGKSFVILEGREAIGGTWDLFRYPGIRSDSDMYTLGYAFKPWTDGKAIADGPSILNYVRETARENGIEPHIRFKHMVKRLSWSSADSRWTVEAEHEGRPVRLTAKWVMMCAGYYRYDAGYLPDWKGKDRFKGQWVHPQHWPENLDYAGKKVLVIGSGATAVTLVPAMAETAGHVTMLQRSPTYMVSRPARDWLANGLRKIMPAMWAYDIIRWRNVVLQRWFYNIARTQPEKTKERMVEMAAKLLPPDYDVKKHFTPTYNPWDQRVCLVPDEDMFKAIREGRASVVTDTIETFTEKGVKLVSGQEIEADIIVTATGLQVQAVGGADISVDGAPIALKDTFIYKGLMYSGVPNLANVFGYTNASWTLKADLTCEYVCRLLAHMDANGFTKAVPVVKDPNMPVEPWVDFSSGYIQRALPTMPKQGANPPWKLYQNYFEDMKLMRDAPLEDEAMTFSKALTQKAAAPEAVAAE